MGILKGESFEEGELLNRWINNRMIRNNKNILTATTGPTGSAKSYQDLRKAELWYKFHFKKPFPAENICFSIAEIMTRLSSGELKKGEILILEEAGTNMGSLDFQNKVCKLFTYVLQSFRSMNIGIFFNLPHLSMLNKQARILIHIQFETCGINYTDKTSKCKAFFRQVNQNTGKIYNKYLRIKKGGVVVPVKRFNYSLPTKELIDIYEKKKFKFVHKLSEDFSRELEQKRREEEYKLSRNDLTEIQQEIYDDLAKGFSVKEIANRRQCDLTNIYKTLQRIKKKGFDLPKTKNTMESRDIRV